MGRKDKAADREGLEKRDRAVRAVLRPTDAPIRLTHVPPAEDLRPYVALYWIVEWDARDPYVQETLPHPCVHLVVQGHQGLAYGVVKGKFSIVLQGRSRAFGIKFRPGGFYPFLRGPLSRLTNRTEPVSAFFDVNAAARFTGAPDVASAEHLLRGARPRRAAAAETAGQIAEAIADDRTLTTVDGVATRFDVPTRALQRMFSRYIGVSPKWVINRYRLHEVVERLTRGETVDWARLAADLGYFDQAHLIRDFKAVVGQTPGAYERQRVVGIPKNGVSR